jgi:hydrogenase maturation protease
MKTLIFGAGNLLLSDEGFGIHLVRRLEERYAIPEDIDICDGGTLGIMATHRFEAAERVFLVDTVFTENGNAGELLRFEKEQIMFERLPIKLSPHQIGIQETLVMCDLRGRSPERVTLFGVIPGSLEAGVTLSEAVEAALERTIELLVAELRMEGWNITEKSTYDRGDTCSVSACQNWL